MPSMVASSSRTVKDSPPRRKRTRCEGSGGCPIRGDWRDWGLRRLHSRAGGTPDERPPECPIDAPGSSRNSRTQHHESGSNQRPPSGLRSTRPRAMSLRTRPFTGIGCAQASRNFPGAQRFGGGQTKIMVTSTVVLEPNGLSVACRSVSTGSDLPTNRERGGRSVLRVRRRLSPAKATRRVTERLPASL